jgi:hypothetical protein
MRLVGCEKKDYSEKAEEQLGKLVGEVAIKS